MSKRSASIVHQLLAARSAAAAACSQQQQQMSGLAITGARSMSTAAAANSKDGKVLHPDLLNENLKKTQVMGHC
jgi:hypothetical protein